MIILSFFIIHFLTLVCQKNLQEQQQAGGTDEAEPFMGSGRFGNKNDLNLNLSCYP